MRREDPLGRQRPEYKRNVAVEREGTRKPVQPKTVTDGGRDPLLAFLFAHQAV